MNELLSQTDAAISGVSEYIDEYEMFIEWIEQAESDFDDFSESEQAAFVEAFSQFSIYTEEPVTPNEVVDIRSNMRAVFREPLLEANLDAIQKITDQLEFSLEDSVLDSFNNELKSWPRDELIQHREAYEKVNSSIENVTDAEIVHIREHISRKPHELLKPEAEILRLIGSITNTASRLEEVETVFSQYQWLSLSDRHIGPFSQPWLDTEMPDITDVESIMEGIDDSVNILQKCEIPIGNAISNTLDTKIENPQNDFYSELKELADTLDFLATKMTPLQSISDMIGLIEDGDLGMLDQDALSEIAEKLKQTDPASIDQVITIVSDISEEYSAWTIEVTSRWQTYRSALSVLDDSSTVDELDSFNNEDAFKMALDETPIEALDAFNRLVSVLQDRRQVVGDEDGLSEESIQLLFDLIEQQTIAYNDYSQEAVEELNDVIALQIQINEST